MRVVVIGNIAHVVVDLPVAYAEFLIRYRAEALEQARLHFGRGATSCSRQTTIGTTHISQSAIQQTSSSK